MIYQSVKIISIFAYSYSLNLAEKNKGSLDMVPQKFRDRNFSTFQAVARNGKPKRFSKYGQYISFVTSFIRYKIYYTQTILVIMVLRDCNSNIFNDFKIFFDSKT